LPLERGVNPGCNDNFLIKTASEYGQLNIVKYLCELPLERGVDPSADHNETLYNAVKNKHNDIVKYLCELPVERGIDPDNNDIRCMLDYDD